MFDVTHLIEAGGLILIGAFVLAESGLMVGLFLPGDTLLLSAGVLAATGKLSIVSTIIVIAITAIIGDNIGYQIGKSLGPRLFRKKDGLIFRKEYIDRAEKFYEKYGAKAMLVEHFIPVVRSFAPITAGASRMDRKLFIICNSIGDIAWAVGFTLFGYYVGSRIPHIDKYIEPLLLVIILIFATPTVLHIVRDPKIRNAVRSRFKRQ
jgi:membrane-associated protein